MIRIYLFSETDRKERDRRIAAAADAWIHEKNGLQNASASETGRQVTDGTIRVCCEKTKDMMKPCSEKLPSCQVEKTDCGKPFFKGMPGTYLSLSDTGSFAAVGISDRELGIDLQETGPGTQKDRSLIRMAERFFPERDRDCCLPQQIRDKIRSANREQAWDLLDETEQTAVRSRFYELWTMKEAWCKYTGEGIGKNFLTRSILDVAETLSFKTCEPFPNVVLSVCMERETAQDMRIVYQ